MNKNRVLLIAEHDNQVMYSVTLNTMTAAMACGDSISILVAGQACEDIAQQAAEIDGVSEVLCADDQAYGRHLAENCAALIATIGKDYDYILAPATTFGKNSLPRAAALLNVAQISDVIEIISADTFMRPIYAGNALVTVQSLEPIKVMTVRPTAFKAAQFGQKSVSIKHLSEHHDVKLSQFIELNKTVSER
ncbi:MAG: electron transfer flavoprotein subunit alpha/FixB family protein, partial [Gammaproteobacteria bacterium]